MKALKTGFAKKALFNFLLGFAKPEPRRHEKVFGAFFESSLQGQERAFMARKMRLKFQSSKISVQALPLGPAYTDCDPTPHDQQLLVSGCPISMQQYLSAMLITVRNTMKQNVAIHSH